MTVTAEYSDSKLIADCEISGFKNSFTYTGKNIEQPDVTLTYEGKELKEGVDYTVYYKTNLNAGPAKMTFVGKGEYRGSVAKALLSSQRTLPSSSFIMLHRCRSPARR